MNFSASFPASSLQTPTPKVREMGVASGQKYWCVKRSDFLSRTGATESWREKTHISVRVHSHAYARRQQNTIPSVHKHAKTHALLLSHTHTRNTHSLTYFVRLHTFRETKTNFFSWHTTCRNPWAPNQRLKGVLDWKRTLKTCRILITEHNKYIYTYQRSAKLASFFLFLLFLTSLVASYQISHCSLWRHKRTFLFHTCSRDHSLHFSPDRHRGVCPHTSHTNWFLSLLWSFPPNEVETKS